MHSWGEIKQMLEYFRLGGLEDLAKLFSSIRIDKEIQKSGLAVPR